MPLGAALKKERKKNEAEIARLEALLEKAHQKLDAIDLLIEEENGPRTNEQLSMPINKKNSGGTKRGEVTSNIRKAIAGLPNKFIMVDVTYALAKEGLKYPASTISTVLKRMLEKGELTEGPKEGKGKTYLKK